jgi:acyl carrier protein
VTAQTFVDKLTSFLTSLCSGRGVRVEIKPDTRLFSGRLLDSLSFIELLSFVERSLGMSVPDSKLSMQYFETPRTIAATFFGGGLVEG